MSNQEKEPRLVVSNILVEEELLIMRYTQSGMPLDEARRVALSDIRHKYSQHDY